MPSGGNVSSLSTQYSVCNVGFISKQGIETLPFLETFSTVFHITGRSQKKNTAGLIYYFIITSLYIYTGCFFSRRYEDGKRGSSMAL